MKQSLLYLASFVVALAAAAGLGLLFRDQPTVEATTDMTVLVDRQAPAVVLEITLFEAWDLLEEEASTWAGAWHMIGIASADVNDSPTTESGMDGKRRTWQAQFQDAVGSERWVTVTSGVVVDSVVAILVSGSNGQLPVPDPAMQQPEIQRPSLDSPAAISAVLLDNPDFRGRPNFEKATGIHFKVGQAVPSVFIVQQPSASLSVGLANSDGNSVSVGFDPESGDVVSNSELIASPGEVVLVQATGERADVALPNSLDPMKLVLGRIGADEVLLLVARDLSARTIKVLRLENLGSGRRWVAVAETEAIGPGEAFWAYGATQVGPPGEEKLQFASLDRLWTMDLTSWSLSSARQGQPVALSQFQRPFEPSELVAEVGGETHRIRFSQAGVERSTNDGASWTTVLEATRGIVGLATAANYAKSGVAAVNVWRDGVWLTHDYSASWQRADSNSADIGSLLVYADGDAVAFIEMGTSEWRDH